MSKRSERKGRRIVSSKEGRREEEEMEGVINKYKKQQKNTHVHYNLYFTSS